MERKTEFVCVLRPAYVKYTCPYCGEEVEIDYDDFSHDMAEEHWKDWIGYSIFCESCGEEVGIGSFKYE